MFKCIELLAANANKKCVCGSALSYEPILVSTKGFRIRILCDSCYDKLSLPILKEMTSYTHECTGDHACCVRFAGALRYDKVSSNLNHNCVHYG